MMIWKGSWQLMEAMPMPDRAPQTEAEVFRRRLKREMQAEGCTVWSLPPERLRTMPK